MHPLDSLEVPEGIVAIHWFEQSAYAIKDSAGTVALVDPYFPKDRPPDRFIHPEPPLDETTLKTDYVLLTHDHGDHTCIESLIRIHEGSPGVRCVCPKESAANIAKNTPIPDDQVTVVEAGQAADVGTMEATAVYAKAPEGDPERDIKPPDVTHLGFVLEASGATMYFTGDLFNSFAERDDMVEAVARLRPDVGFLTNHPAEGEFPFFDGSVKMAQRIGLKHAVPAHYQCFVTRNYDPNEYAALFPDEGPTKPLIIPWNSCVLYPPE